MIRLEFMYREAVNVVVESDASEIFTDLSKAVAAASKALDLDKNSGERPDAPADGCCEVGKGKRTCPLCFGLKRDENGPCPLCNPGHPGQTELFAFELSARLD